MVLKDSFLRIIRSLNSFMSFGVPEDVNVESSCHKLNKPCKFPDISSDARKMKQKLQIPTVNAETTASLESKPISNYIGYYVSALHFSSPLISISYL